MESVRVVISRVPFRSRQGDSGVTSIEYGLIATTVAVLVAFGLAGLAPKIMALFNAIGS